MTQPRKHLWNSNVPLSKLLSPKGACLRFLGAAGFTLLLLNSAVTNAAVTISAVDRASNVEGLGTASITVYGGTAGIDSGRGTIASTSTADTCKLTAPGETFAAPDDGLLVCNNRAIHGDLELVFTLNSDAIDGNAIITDSTGATKLTTVAASTNLAKGTTGSITVKWDAICDKIFPTGSGLNCKLTTDTQASGTLRVGIAPASDPNSLAATGADYRTVNFVIRRAAGQASGLAGSSTVTNCDDDDNAVGICYFEVGAGDEKAVMKSLGALNGFPSSDDIQFKFVRVLYSDVGFSSINLESAHQDLPIQGSGVSTFSVSPKRIEGLTNDRVYYFKTAVVDAAGNVGYYTRAADDTYCANSGIPGDTACHTSTPSEVVGVLSNTNCFIATAAYGSTFAKELETLRDFRDQFLLSSKAGRHFVHFYNLVSPPIAKAIFDSDTARAIVRGALLPIVALAKFALRYGALSAALLAATIVFVIVGLISLLYLRLRQRSSRDARGDGGETTKATQLTILVPLLFAVATWDYPATALASESLSSGPTENATENATEKPTKRLTGVAHVQKALAKPKRVAAADDDSPPPPEYPYPGAGNNDFPDAAPTPTDAAPIAAEPTTDPTTDPTTEPSVEPLIEPLEGNTAPTQVAAPSAPPPVAPVPIKQKVVRPRITPKPKSINEDGDYIYEANAEPTVKQYGPPKKVEFSKLPGRDAPETITADGEFLYPIEKSEFVGAAGFRFGMMTPPSIKNPDNQLTFKDIYGSDMLPSLLFEYEYPLTRAIGRVGIKAESGFYAKQAQGRFKNPSRITEVPDERFTFLMIPLQASIIYRFQYSDDQLIVPFVEGGGAYYGIAELRDDNKRPRTAGAPAAVAAGGINILLDALDRHAINQLDAEYGINHVWFSLQYRQIVGLKSDLDVSSSMFTGGFTFDF